MRKIERTIYNFNELEKEVQERLIKQERENEKDFYCDDFLYDDMGSKASDLINDYFGIISDYLKVYYDLSYSQGSGAMVEFNVNIKDLNNKYKIFSSEEIRFLTDKGIVDDIKIRHNDNFYYHEYTFGIDYDYYNDWSYEDIKNSYGITEKEFETLDDRFYSLVDYSNKHNTESPFIKDIVSMNKELSKYGYDSIEYYDNCSDDEIINCLLIDNEYYKNGTIYGGEE